MQLFKFAFLASFSVLAVFGQAPPATRALPAGYTDAIRRIVSARTEVTGAATALKARCTKSNDPCNTAMLSYNKAKGAYDGWIAVVKMAIKKGSAKRLKLDDPEYKQPADQAAKASADFLNYAEQTLTGQTKAVAPAVLSIVDLGVKVWTQLRNLQQESRDREAESFAKEVTWPAWADIK